MAPRGRQLLASVHGQGSPRIVKPNGSLQKLILLKLGKKTRDKIPRSLLVAGMFEDPDSRGLMEGVVLGGSDFTCLG